MKSSIFVLFFVFIGVSVMAQELSIPASDLVLRTTSAIASEKIYSSSEYDTVKKELNQVTSNFNTLLQIFQQQKADKEMIFSAILSITTIEDLEKIKVSVRNLIISSMSRKEE